MLLHFETFAMFPQLQCINLIKMQGLHLLIPESHDNFVLENVLCSRVPFQDQEPWVSVKTPEMPSRTPRELYTGIF